MRKQKGPPFIFGLQNGFMILDAFLTFSFLDFDLDLFRNLGALFARVRWFTLRFVFSCTFDSPVITTGTFTVAFVPSFDQLV